MVVIRAITLELIFKGEKIAMILLCRWDKIGFSVYVGYIISNRVDYRGTNQRIFSAPLLNQVTTV